MSLPIDSVLPELLAALREHPAAVLQAPPGALTVEQNGMRTEYGEYSYLKYWLPKSQLYRPQFRSGGRS